jgi:DNA-binding IclR family transcriptional regulator
MRTKRSKSAPVGVIGKVLRVLELLDQSPAGLQLKEVAAKTGINKSTAHRFLSHLESEAYLFRDFQGTYMLGPKLVRLGSGVNFQATLCNISRPTLEKLWKITDETVNLAVLDGSSILYLDVLESLHTFRLVSQVGMRRALHCTSLGKAILANMDDERRKEEIFASIQFTPDTGRTLTNVARLKKDLIQTRQQGYSLDDEEAVVGARCIGAAIFGADGKVVGAISVSGPVSRVSKERLPVFCAEISKAAREISWRLGYRIPKGERRNSDAKKLPAANPNSAKSHRGKHAAQSSNRG